MMMGAVAEVVDVASVAERGLVNGVFAERFALIDVLTTSVERTDVRTAFD